MKNVIITSVLALMLATGANAKNIYVSPDGSTSNNGNSWDSPISDLGTAYSKASKGDVILMAAGTYTVTATINMIEGVHVYGGFAKGETSIENRVRPNAATEPWKFTNETIITSGNQTFRLVDRVDKDTFWENTIIDGITFKNNVSTDSRVLYLRNSVTLQNCQILNNACKGTVVYGEENMIVRNCYFSGNNTSDATYEATVTLQLRGCHSEYFPGNQLYDCVFEGNKVPSLSIYNTEEQLSDQDGTSVTNCIFRNNESSCIQINNQWAKRYLKITHCLFEGNVSSNIGTVLSGNSEVYYDFAFNIIRNNTNTSVAGGDSWRNSIIATKKNAQIENCLIVNNASDNLLIDLQGSTIFNNTIANNKGTIYVGENYSQVVNSIMVNNQPTHNDKAVFTTENSAVQYSASDIEITDNSSTNSVTLLNNIVEANPFVQTTTFVGSTTDETDIQALQNADFSLTSTSLCNNAGSVEFIDEFFMTEEWMDEFMSKDIADNDRIVDGKINMGAYQGGKGTGLNNEKETVNCDVIVEDGIIYVLSEKDGYATLYNINGAMLESKEIRAGSNSSMIVSEKGLYLVRVVAGNQVKAFKVIIK